MKQMSKETVSGKRFLTAAELAEWSKAERIAFWAPDYEMLETDSTVNVVIDLPVAVIV